MRRVILTVIGLAIATCGCARNMTSKTIPGRELALRSGGAASESTGGWTLAENGYVGTYVRLGSPGNVTVRVSASAAGDRPAPLEVIIADHRAAFEAGPDPTPRDLVFALPAGTHFIRIQSTSGQPLTIRDVAIDGATVLNDHTDANALAAADTYAEHFRRGRAIVKLPDHVKPGTPARVKLRRHAFLFGTIATSSRNVYLIDNPEPGSDAAKWQAFVNAHFNALVPSNAGKWVFNEPSPGWVDLEYVDAILAYTRRHGMSARMHTLIWDTEQQPQWARSLLHSALAGDPASKGELRRAIGDRIDYYVRPRAKDYVELDVVNESVHRRGYWELFGSRGVADIYNEVEEVARRSTEHPPRLYLNEYNVLQWSRDPAQAKETAADDPYANWYRAHVEALLGAGGAVNGIGVQYYCSANPEARQKCPHSPARIHGVMQNLSTVGLPISLTEFGIRKEASPDEAATILDETMRLVFGTPQATTFMIWGFWAGAVTPNDISTALVDKEWNLTPAGHAYERLMARWNTDEQLTVRDDGTIEFTGFFGDYDIITNGGTTLTLTFTHVKNQSSYTISSR